MGWSVDCPSLHRRVTGEYQITRQIDSQPSFLPHVETGGPPSQCDLGRCQKVMQHQTGLRDHAPTSGTKLTTVFDVATSS
jgi:hypothetical protein